MKLFEVISLSDEPMFKGRSADPSTYTPADNAYELRIEELKNHIEGWKDVLKRRPNDPHVKWKIDNMEDDLRGLQSIGEIPFTFYAARDREGAQFFADQFSDGEVVPVKISAKNLATVDDVRKLKDEQGRPIGFGKQTVSHLTSRQVHALKKAGFDGARGEIDRVGGVEVVVFSPEQVKPG